MSSIKFCSNCGSSIQSNENFCSNCGFKVKNSTEFTELNLLNDAGKKGFPKIVGHAVISIVTILLFLLTRSIINNLFDNLSYRAHSSEIIIVFLLSFIVSLIVISIIIGYGIKLNLIMYKKSIINLKDILLINEISGKDIISFLITITKISAINFGILLFFIRSQNVFSIIVLIPISLLVNSYMIFRPFFVLDMGVKSAEASKKNKIITEVHFYKIVGWLFILALITPLAFPFTFPLALFLLTKLYYELVS
ncbi:zinc ribbon domain-containing protein [Natronospora cellulosivora (SeqCode)]